MNRWKAGIMAAGMALLGVAGSAAAKERNVQPGAVPSEVRRAVAARYPGAQPSRYAEETEKGKTAYEVTLDVNGHATELSVAPDGRILSEETRLAEGELPGAVRDGLARSRYAGARLVRAESELKDGQTKYELLVDQKGEASELVFNDRGNLVKASEADEADEAHGGQANEAHEQAGEEAD